MTEISTLEHIDALLEEGLKNKIRAGYFEWFKAWAFGIRRIVAAEGYIIKYYYYNGKYYLANIIEIKGPE